MGELSKHKLRL